MLLGLLRLGGTVRVVGLVFLEGIDDELVVGYGVDGVVGHMVQFGPQSAHLCFADAEHMVQQGPDVDIGLQIIDLEHLALTAVLDTEPVKLCIKGQQVDAHAVNLNGGLQLVLKDVGSALKQSLLETGGIDDEESCNQQGNCQSHQYAGYTYGPFQQLLHGRVI